MRGGLWATGTADPRRTPGQSALPQRHGRSRAHLRGLDHLPPPPQPCANLLQPPRQSADRRGGGRRWSRPTGNQNLSIEGLSGGQLERRPHLQPDGGPRVHLRFVPRRRQLRLQRHPELQQGPALPQDGRGYPRATTRTPRPATARHSLSTRSRPPSRTKPTRAARPAIFLPAICWASCTAPARAKR